MAKHLLDYDPISGSSCYMNYDHALDKIVLTHEQDVQKVLDFATALRNDESYTRAGIKNDFLHYALIPAVVQLEMKQKHNVDFWDKRQDAQVYGLINTEYSRFKVTDIYHTVANGKK
jgi:hypothetical protein